MATNFWNGYDGSGRLPRDVQIRALTWVEKHLGAKVLALSLPTGSGKSFLAKTIADKLGAHVITPANALIDQYVETYPSHNSLKGKRHYTCKSGLSCYDWTNLCEQKPCRDCPYEAAKKSALERPTFFNPLSMYYLTLHEKWRPSRVLVVDEAHTLGSMLLMLAGVRLPYSQWRFPRDISEVYLVPYLQDMQRKLEALVVLHKKSPKQLKETINLLEQVKLTAQGLREDAQNYAIYTTEGTYRRKKETFLHINPLKPPRFLVDKLFDSRQVILMSGTLFKPDIVDLIGDSHFEYLDLPSPIPVDNRRIYYKPAPFPMNYQSDPRQVVRLIETILDYHPGENAIVHVTYGMSQRLRPYFNRRILYNDATNKDKVIAEFKANGGVFLAAGCAEGLDLPGDLCRVNIIPKMPFPDLGDITVQKRKALEDGDDWYSLSTFKTLIQQCGRSTRNETDFSKTYILDSNFSRLYRQAKEKLPTYFKEAIVWGGS